MNKQERVKRIMALKDVVVNYSKHRGGVYVHGDDFNHFLVKSAVFKVLSEAGHEVVTEAEFKDGTIADVLDASTGIVYEIQGDTSVDKVSPYMDKDVVQDVIVLDLDGVLFSADFSDIKTEIELKRIIEKKVVV